MSDAKRFLLLHAKSDSESRIEMLRGIAHAAIERQSKGKPFSITTGRDQFEARFKACGSWDAWAADCATGVSLPMREPLFHGFLVPWNDQQAAGESGVLVGAGTARIVELARAAGKPVFVFDGAGKVTRVLGCRHVSPSWQAGWCLDVGDRG